MIYSGEGEVLDKATNRITESAKPFTQGSLAAPTVIWIVLFGIPD